MNCAEVKTYNIELKELRYGLIPRIDVAIFIAISFSNLLNI